MNNKIIRLGDKQQGLTSPLSGVNRQTAKELMRCHDEMSKDLILAQAREDGRAILAQSSMVNTAALGGLEAQLSRTTPLAKPQLQAIVDAYAIASAQTILRW